MRKVFVAFVAGGIVLALVGCSKRRKHLSDDESKVEALSTATTAKTAGEPGITPEQIVLASSSSFTGANAEWGTEQWRGSQAYFAEINASGGVHGRQIVVKLKDDNYKVDRVLENIRAFAAEDDSFMFYNFVGSALMRASIEELGKNKQPDRFIFGAVASSAAYREGPSSEHAYEVRASVREEMKEVVAALYAAGKRRFAVFHQDDAYGRGGLDGSTKALAAYGLTPVATAVHKPQHKFDESLLSEVGTLRQANADAILCTASYQAGAALARDARGAGWDVWIHNNASINDTFLRTIHSYEKASNKKVLTNLIGTQIVPSPDDTTVPLVTEYRQLMLKRNPQLPTELADPNYRTLEYGFQSLEGFMNAKVITEIFRRLGDKPTRASFRELLASGKMNDYDPGIGQTLKWGPGDQQGLDRVWLFTVKDDKYVALTDPKALAASGAKPSGIVASGLASKK